VAPATVFAGDAGAHTYVAALRRAGVPVDELDDLRELAGLGQAITAAG
jgi:ABC-type hemin transport system substrate-binding protein